MSREEHSSWRDSRRLLQAKSKYVVLAGRLWRNLEGGFPREKRAGQDASLGWALPPLHLAAAAAFEQGPVPAGAQGPYTQLACLWGRPGSHSLQGETKRVCSSYANCCLAPTEAMAVREVWRQPSGWATAQLPPPVPTPATLPAAAREGVWQLSPRKAEGRQGRLHLQPGLSLGRWGLKDQATHYPRTSELKNPTASHIPHSPPPHTLHPSRSRSWCFLQQTAFKCK